jgi:hypothetical protein
MSVPLPCTLGFVPPSTLNDTLYVSTVGHCVEEGDRVATPSVGASGTADFVADGGLGEDVALVRVDESQTDDMVPRVCGWSGPTGLEAGDALPGEVLYE